MILDLSPAQIGLIVATFLASAVEVVESFTIVLAMGLTRGWRSTLIGAALALVVLAVVTVVAGYTILTVVPESLLQLIIGTLLLVFGLQWLRKAILRSGGIKALHDEDAIFASETAAASQAGRRVVAGLDWFAFVVAFKGVFLEGLEVVFIVLTFGLNADDLPLAATGAGLAVVVVLVVGVIAHRPLSQVPENTIKFAVGLLLSTFGTFWAIEGLGVLSLEHESLEWPAGDAMLLIILGAWLLTSWTLIQLLRRSSGLAARTGVI